MEGIIIIPVLKKHTLNFDLIAFIH
jgi:hypothetical protein